MDVLEFGTTSIGAGHVQSKRRTWGTLNGIWVPHDIRDGGVDYVRRWRDRAGLPAKRILHWMGVPEGTFYDWRQRYGKVNEHNGWIPRDHWLEAWEKDAVLKFHFDHPLEGDRDGTARVFGRSFTSDGRRTRRFPLSSAVMVARRHG